jgi:hypothetical protein
MVSATNNISKQEEYDLLHHNFCKWCGSRVYYDNNVRSNSTGGRIPLSIEDKKTPHTCASFEAVKDIHSSKYGIDKRNK